MIDIERDEAWKELIKSFEDFAKNENALDHLDKIIAPDIVGKQYEMVRKVILLALASHGTTENRSRIHVLLLGSPGTGKSEMLRWIKLNCYSKFVDAQYTSKVGLVGDARGNDITPGMLAECDGKIICIDELDKMSFRDQYALLESMEQGEYTIVKGKHKRSFNARVTVIASANERDKIYRALLDRFDFIFELKPASKKERAEHSSEIVKSFFGLSRNVNPRILREYLRWTSEYQPELNEQYVDIVANIIKEHIMIVDDIEERSYRNLEIAILKTATAIAKLHHRNILPDDVVKAIELRSAVDKNHRKTKFLMKPYFETADCIETDDENATQTC